MTVTDLADLADLADTRRTMHGVAEHLLAATARRTAGWIHMTVRDGALSTPDLPGPVARLELRADGHLVRYPEGLTVPLDGTFATLAERLDIMFGLPDPPYPLASGVGPDDPVVADVAALEALLGALAVGDAALRAFAPDSEPVAWPEHLDIGISLDEVNYGVSPGDSYLGEPYAYVGPHEPREGAFFNAPFGAARSLTALAGQGRELPTDVQAFFAQGRALSTR